MMHNFKQNSSPELNENFLGVMHTVWSSAEDFIANYYKPTPETNEKGSEAECFKAIVGALKNLEENK
jgi:hypothetical protein